jgi:coenzyme F420-0:L-glutamate ligase / coenzyme F420-1:gamma-L-glutamate ligase
MVMTLTPIERIPLIQPGLNLADQILRCMAAMGLSLQDGDVLVLAQKIVSKSEGRLVNLVDIVPTEQATALAVETEKDPRLVELILRESREVLRTRPGTIIVEHRLGFVCANAGIDHSNVAGSGDETQEWVLLLPENPDHSANRIRKEIRERTGVNVGVLIIDSHGRAWRLGVLGTAIGLAGMPGLVDLRGCHDLFGYELRITQVAVADELAAAASLVMGQAAEGHPAVHVRGFPYPLREGSFSELLRPHQMDLFR